MVDLLASVPLWIPLTLGIVAIAILARAIDSVELEPDDMDEIDEIVARGRRNRCPYCR